MNYKLILLIILFSIFFNISLSFSQTYYFDNYGVKDGLAQSTVYSVIQDSKGYLWIGTKSGVSKFDGKNFINYTTDDGLAEKGVFSIIQDSMGNIWFGHWGGGITRFNGKVFEELSFNNKLTKVKNNQVTSFLEDDGILYVSTVSGGLLKISNPYIHDISKFDYSLFGGENGLSDRVFFVYKLADGTLCFITDVGIKYYNKKTETFDFYKIENLPEYFSLTCMLEDRKNNLWFGTHNGGVYKYNKKTKKVKIFDIRDGLAHNFTVALTEDSRGNIWVASWGGGITKISSNGKLKVFNSDNGLEDNRIASITEDREGNIVCGSYEHGLYVFKGSQFISYTTKDGLINNQVWAITQDDSGYYWFGTNEGITKFDDINSKAKSQIKYFSKDNQKFGSIHIRFIKQDVNKNLWIGTADNRVWKYNFETDSFNYILSINRWFPRNFNMVTAMEIDNKNNLWVGTADGLIFYDIDQGISNRITQINGIAGNDISALHCTSDGILWVGSRGRGLATINNTEFSLINLEKSLTPTSITSDKSNNIWIGTEGQGVFRLNKDSIVNYKTTNGLLSNFISLVDIDNKNNIYIGTNLGLNRYNIAQDKFFTYSRKSGFTGIEIKNNASLLDDKGNMWFGTINGAIKFDLKEEKNLLKEPIIFIEKITVNLIERKLKSGLVLNHNENSIRIDYKSISFSNPSEVKYKIILEGAEERWQPITKATHVNFSSLKPGRYAFKVIANNDNSKWSSKALTYKFWIKPPFYASWWFFIFVAVFISVIILLYVKIRTRNLIKEKKILEEKVSLRTKEVVSKKEQIEREKETSEELLLNILPIKVVEELKKTGKTEPESFDNVTILFSDIINFTEKSSALEPKVIIDELNELFTAFDDIMASQHCERLKTIGDAYLAVCGMPTHNEMHAENILKAGVKMLEYLRKRNRTAEIKWQIRIGIHSGKAVGGIVGVRKYIYDVFGDSINTASRMESHSEPMKINVSEATYNILKDKYRFIKREDKDVKGLGKIRMYFLKN
ncbi:MAG: adenylate/guanylate cyclase domain-containing protein [Bacteroidota bacterium]|nr:adenylate/guanylate cyclase domain-containing protein [Bacteroidota bacterium]